MSEPLQTPDGRYIIVRGRLWRTSNPHLSPEERQRLIDELMAARRAKRDALRTKDAEAREAARQRVDAVKRTLGERGSVWWTDGAPDENRKLVKNSSYAAWYTALPQS